MIGYDIYYICIIKTQNKVELVKQGAEDRGGNLNMTKIYCMTFTKIQLNMISVLY